MKTEQDARYEEFDKLEGRLAADGFVRSVCVLSETDSTNRVAKELASQGAPEGTLVVARRQSAGRGRLGRSFFSPEGGIYMSMILRPGTAAEQAVMITTCAAVAAARAIETVCGVSAGIKWVNDIFVNGKKVCGILAEAGFEPDRQEPAYVVLGIGINVKKQSVPEELKDIVGCLEECAGCGISKDELIAVLWEEFGKLYENRSTAVYMEEYRRRSVLLGKEVTVLAASGNYTAVAVDISDDGHLVVDRQGMRETLSNGEVSVRL